MLRPLRAFAVQETDEMTGAIYFARHAIEARKAGADEHGDGDLTSVTCRRAPWADAFSGRPLPAREMIAHGWYFECSSCGRRIDEDSLADRRLSVDGVIGAQHSLVFCNAACCRRHLSHERRRKAEEQRAIAAFKDIVRARFPDADFCGEETPYRTHHAYVRPTRGGWSWEQVIVAFRFPGMRYGPATFRLDGCHRPRPHRADYSCCNGDREAFEAYARATQPTRQQEDRP